MCGRFALNEDPLRLAEYFQLSGEVDFSPSWNIAPSLRICTITADEDEKRHLGKRKWGLIPSWATDVKIGNKLSNARGETVAKLPSFRSAFKYHRCIIPASGFYEWKTEKGVKYPWFISLKSGEPMAFAGLCETWTSEKGEAETIESCCIITTTANSLMEPIHDRMPVLLDPDQWKTWLSPQINQPDKILLLIHPHDSNSMQAWPVTRELNRVGLRDDAGLIDPIPTQTLLV